MKFWHRVRGGEKNRPGSISGQAVLSRRWRHVEAQGPATRSRWQGSWGGRLALPDAGPPIGLGGAGVARAGVRRPAGIAGLLLRVVIGEGQRVVPMAFAVRCPDARGPDGPCRDQLTWLQGMRDRTAAALRRRCRRSLTARIVADRWGSDAGLRTPGALSQQGPLRVAGQPS